MAQTSRLMRGQKKDFEAVILADRDYRNNHRKSEQTRHLKALESGIYLCIDQFQESGKGDLKILDDYGVPDLPKSVSEINPPSSKTQLSGSNHHYYTHRGWDMDYGKYDLANWKLRKLILLNTVEAVFDFTKVIPNNLFGHRIVEYDSRCNSFAALAYYVHVLGDYLEDDGYTKFSGGKVGSQKMQFARKESTVSDENRDLFWEIEKHLNTLFADYKRDQRFLALMRDFRSVAREARILGGSTGGINTTEKYLEAHALAEKLMALLSGVNESTHGKRYDYKNWIHTLLSEEDYFKRVFGE